MIPLPSQEFLESLIQKGGKHEPIVIIRFTAPWCHFCHKIDMKFLVNLSDKIKWYECDLDENDYTPGYCGVRKIPAFMAIVNGVPQPIFQCSDTMKVAEWIKGGFRVFV